MLALGFKNFRDIHNKAKEMEKQQQGYSEEDLKNAFFSGCQSERQLKPRVKCWQEWFEQFKKKQYETNLYGADSPTNSQNKRS